MKNKTKKLISMILAVLIVTGLLTASPVEVFADDAEKDPVLLTGKCGADEANTDVEFFCFDDGSMAIFGTGAMKNYNTDSQATMAPWYGYNFSTLGATLFVTKIAVEYGITAIGDYSFYLDDRYPYTNYVQLQNVDIANTVTSIGKYAFYNQKIQQIVLPPTVTHIGANAFKGCSLSADKPIIYNGNPHHLTWDTEGDTDTEFPNGMNVHIFTDYRNDVTELNHKFRYKNITFTADIQNPYAQEGEAYDRNIAAYYSSVNSNVFGGAAPFVIVGRFDGKKKSVTYGSNGFVSCVQMNNNYYMLTDNNTGKLNKVIYNSTTGKATGYSKDAADDIKLQLNISHKYIGSNTVKMIYTLKNTGTGSLSNLKLGGTGDIKIGADDTAAIEPLNEGDKQVGFYMKSGKEYDKSSSGDYATLGFIGKNIPTDGNQSYSDANFFYGNVDANKTNSAAGTKSIVFMPERVFEKNNPLSHETGEFAQGKDSGMSYYWDNISLSAGEEKKFAVLFSVYGAKDSESAGAMITDLDENKFYNVTWKDWDNSTLVTQVVKKGETPVYPGATPTRPRDNQNNSYTFMEWTPTKTENIGGTNYVTEYTAAYNSTHNKLFRGHSLTLRGDIGVNFFVDVTPEQVRDGVTIKFDWYDQHSEYTLHESDYDTESGFYKARCNVAAAEMTDNIHATAYFDGEKYTQEDDNYTVRKYGLDVLDKTTKEIQDYSTNHSEQYAKLAYLVKTMLDYGTKAQIVFNHNNSEDKFANKDIGYSMSDVNPTAFDNAIKAENGNKTKSDMTSSTDSFGLKYYNTSVVFLSRTSLRHYYTITDKNTYDKYKNGASFKVYENKPPYVYFELQDIPAAKLDQLQEFKIGEQTYYFSVLDFAKGLLDDGRSTAQKDLGKATYWYNQAANSFFGE